MQKIIIVGAAGSGKSTLAKRIAKKIGANHTELDSIYHQPGWKPIETDAFIQTVASYTQAESWVIDGNYISRLGLDFWKKADVVIWLDFPFHLVFCRVVSRTLRRGLTRQTLWNGNRESLHKNLFTNDSVIRHMLKTWKKQKERYQPIFAENKIGNTTLIRFTNDYEASRFLDELVRK